MPKLQQLVFLPPQGTAREPFTTSEIIADVAGMKRDTVYRLVTRHKADLEEFGRVGFEIRPLKTKGGTQNITVYHLNEQQATLLMTYARNTEEIRAGIAAKKPYKEIYTDLQTRLSGIKALVSPAQPTGARPALGSGSGQGKDTTKAAKSGRKGNEHE